MKLGHIRRRIVTLAITATLVTSSRAQEQSPPNAQLPADLALVSTDTPLFFAFDLTKYWDGSETESLTRVANAHPVVLTWGLKEMPTNIGLEPENVVRVTTFNDATAMTTAILTKGPYDREKVLAAWTPEAVQRTAASKMYFFSEKTRNSAYFVDDHTLLLEAGQDLGSFFMRPVSVERNVALDHAIDAVQHGAPFVANVGTNVIRSLGAETGIKSTPMAPLAQASAWQIITAIDKHLTIDVRAEFATKEEAQSALPAMQALGNSLTGLVPFYKSHMAPFLDEQATQYPAAKEVAPELMRALDAAEKGLRAIHVGTVQNAAVARIEIDTDKPLTTAVMLLTLMPRAAKTH